ncbi:hypothetical protein HPP92_011142 [Vanilla planifolia]|uniref:Uncharacterized protein n=1 Tax=Vanilla planifolia TaxID=51239 RepID=A0A835R1A9_VANPL|nr:hypothetical protein HPP92_011142 [Vanilla planifolia]
MKFELAFGENGVGEAVRKGVTGWRRSWDKEKLREKFRRWSARPGQRGWNQNVVGTEKVGAVCVNVKEKVPWRQG